MSAYLLGTDCLGASSGDDQALVIRVRNLPQLVKSQGGATGSLAFQLTPQTVTNMVYGKMRDEMEAQLRGKGVDADVQIVASPPKGSAPNSELISGVVLGAGAAGLLWLLVQLFKKL